MEEKMERKELGFQDAVNKYFGFLGGFGFRCVFSSLYLIKFESSKVYIDIYHEKNSFEIYFVLRFINDEKLKLTSQNFEAIFSPQHASKCYQGSNRRNVNFCVDKIADIAKKYGKDALLGSEQFFRGAVDSIDKEQEKKLLIEEAKIYENKAKKAWESKDYAAIIEIYSKFKMPLSALQEKRLEFARKHAKRED